MWKRNMSGTNPNTDWSTDWNSWHVMKVTPCRSVGDTADVIPGVLSSKSSNSKFSESFKFSRYLRLGAWCHGWIMGCCVGWVLWVREVLGAVDSWVLLGVGAALTQREKEFGSTNQFGGGKSGTQSKAAVGGALSDCDERRRPREHSRNLTKK